jgi:hypothetical protein
LSEQPNIGDLLCEASKALGEAADKLDAAQLLEGERRKMLHDGMRKLVAAVSELSDLVQEVVG